MNLFPNLADKNLILASASPRRQQLLNGLNIPFEVRVIPTDESFPENLSAFEIPIHIAQLKSKVFESLLKDNEIIITADTVVWIEGEVLNKPSDRQEAIAMLTKLSGKMHQVFTAVCISSSNNQCLFYDETRVYFKQLTLQEIEFYIDNYKPYDKAGSYGAQDWIGLVAIDRLEGSYFNVMGLPIHLVYENLKEF